MSEAQISVSVEIFVSVSKKYDRGKRNKSKRDPSYHYIFKAVENEVEQKIENYKKQLTGKKGLYPNKKYYVEFIITKKEVVEK